MHQEDRFDGPVRVLSDLHLGHSGCVIEKVAQLEPLIEGAGTVVFNGDTFEQMESRFRERSGAMLEELKRLCRRLGAEAVFLTGNHDPDINGEHSLDLGKGKVLVCHGDTLFPMVSPWSRTIRDSRPLIEAVLAEYSERDLQCFETRLEMTRRSARVMKRVSFEVESSLSARLKLLARELWPPRRPGVILGAWLRAPGLAVSLLERYRPEAGLIVFGHTHFPGVWRRRGRTAVNTGGYLGVLNARVVEVNSRGAFFFPVVRRRGEFRVGERSQKVL